MCGTRCGGAKQRRKMGMLVLGLVLFLGAHSVRIFADNARTRAIARLGEMGWKGLYSVVSLIGFGLIIWGFAQLDKETMNVVASTVANVLLFCIIIGFIVALYGIAWWLISRGTGLRH